MIFEYKKVGNLFQSLPDMDAPKIQMIYYSVVYPWDTLRSALDMPHHSSPLHCTSVYYYCTLEGKLDFAKFKI